MHRRIFLKNTGLTLGALALLDFNSFANIISDPAYKIKMITSEIGIFTEKGGTILFMLNDKGVVIVDSQFPDTATHLVEEIKKKTDKQFNLLVNTHHHGDHTSGNILFKGLVSNVVAHANSKANQIRVATENNTTEKQLFPDLTFTESWSKKFKREKLKMHYFGAAHTNGDSIVHFQNADVIHMGDLVFNRRHPVIDKTSGADIANWIKVLEKTISKFGNKTTYVTGHAREGLDVIVKSSDVLAFRDYLGNLLKFTESEIKSGKTRIEFLKATTIPGSPEWQGAGIEKPLAAAYTELTAHLQ